MVRAILSLAALLVVLYAVMHLGRTQLASLAPPTSIGSGGDGSAASPARAAEAAAQRVTDALKQGAERRASESSP